MSDSVLYRGYHRSAGEIKHDVRISRNACSGRSGLDITCDGMSLRCPNFRASVECISHGVLPSKADLYWQETSSVSTLERLNRSLGSWSRDWYFEIEFDLLTYSSDGPMMSHWCLGTGYGYGYGMQSCCLNAVIKE